MIDFQDVRHAPLRGLTVSAPAGAVIGLLGERDSGETALLRLASGLDQPASGHVQRTGTARYLSVTDALNLDPVDTLLLDHTFAQADALVRARALVALDHLRAGGATVLLASHETDLLRAICDEVWWLNAGALAMRGDPSEVIEAYNRHIETKFRAWGETLSVPISPALRKGDGRAEIVALETIGESGKPSAVLHSGESATIRVVVRFQQAVENPVIGIMIRTRIGLEVYGTNTDLEKAPVGPCGAGESVRLDFNFRCELCPKEYTITAASHDPDGTAHDWMDDAVAFLVSDARYTAGVANLHARVQIERVIPAS